MAQSALVLRFQVDVEVANNRKMRLADVARTLGVTPRTALRLMTESGLTRHRGVVSALTKENARMLLARWMSTSTGRRRATALLQAALLREPVRSDAVVVQRTDADDRRVEVNRERAWRRAVDADE